MEKIMKMLDDRQMLWKYTVIQMFDVSTIFLFKKSAMLPKASII